MVKTREMSTVRLHNFPWKPIKPRPTNIPVYGHDTETKDGYAHIITFSTSLVDSYKTLKKWQDFMDYCLDAKTHKGINFFYNLDFDFSAIAKHLGPRHLGNLASVNVTADEDWELSWIPSKAFTLTIRQDDDVTLHKFFDAAQFYEKKPLKEVASLVGEKKVEFDVKGIDWKKFTKDKEYRNLVLRYAMTDSRICRKLGERLHRAVNQIVPVSNYYSNASIAQAFFLSHIPKDMTLPPMSIMEAAMKSYGGGRFELVRKGYVPHTYEADINSAYPKEMSTLVSTNSKRGKWKTINKINDPSCHYGFYRVMVETHDSIVSPIMHQGDDTIYYPHGKFSEKWLEKSELELVQRMGFKARILEGYEYHDSNPEYPFHFIESEIYPKRLDYKNRGIDDLSYVYKITMNSAYGKTIQLIPDYEIVDELPRGDKKLEDGRVVREIELENGLVKFAIRKGWWAGKMFNPIFAASITGRVRSRLLETTFRHKLEKALVGYATDCLFLDRKPPSSMIGDGLGAWKLEVNDCEGVFVGSGVYGLRSHDEIIDPITKNKKRLVNKNHFRGFTTKRDIFDAIQNGAIITQERGRERRGIVFDMESPVKLKEGVRGGLRATPSGEEMIDWRSIAVFRPIRKVLDLNFDHKREWEHEVTSPTQLLESQIFSKPLTV